MPDEKHIANRVCENVKLCFKCVAYYQRKKSNGKWFKHVCYTFFCKKCSSYKDRNHLCYVRWLVPKNQNKHIDKQYGQDDILINEDLNGSSDSDMDGANNEDCNQGGHDGPHRYQHIYFDFETSVVEGEYLKQKTCEQCENLPINEIGGGRCGVS